MIQDVQLIDNRNACALQVSDRANDISVLHIPKGIVIHANDQQPGMSSGGSLYELVQVLEVVVVLGEEDEVLPDGVNQMAWIGRAGESGVGRDEDLVTSFS